MEMVSRSLISPTNITSGSSLKALRKAEAKDVVCEPISLWETRQFL